MAASRRRRRGKAPTKGKAKRDPKSGTSYGQKGAKVRPGTKKGDAYCARSLGQMKAHPRAAKDPNSALRLSRKRWKCRGAKSIRSKK